MKAFFSLVLISLLSFTAFSKKPIIIIDPGHGGNDPGSLGAFRGKVIKEKDIALKIAKRVMKKLHGEYDVYLTRTSDIYLSPQKRASIAEIVGAELFISIHLNSHENRRFSGFETYYLDNREDKALSRVEQEENQSKTWSDVDKILMDIVVSKTVDRSKKLSRVLHNEIRKKLKPFSMRDRGIKAGLFYVLAFAKRPGVLLEIGFLSNDNDASKLTSTQFQKSYADGIVNGIKNYFSSQN